MYSNNIPSRTDPWNGATTSGVTYFGYAKAGANDDELVWSLRKQSVIGGVLYQQFPYGTGETYNTVFNTTLLSNLRWDLRTGYTYK